MRADFCLQVRSLGIFSLHAITSPSSPVHVPPQGKAALMFHGTLALQRDVGTECDTVVATGQGNPRGLSESHRPLKFSGKEMYALLGD